MSDIVLYKVQSTEYYITFLSQCWPRNLKIRSIPCFITQNGQKGKATKGARKSLIRYENPDMTTGKSSWISNGILKKVFKVSLLLLFHTSKKMSSSLKACCTIPPFESTYTPIGTIEKIGDLDVYTVGPKVHRYTTRTFLFPYKVFYDRMPKRLF